METPEDYEMNEPAQSADAPEAPVPETAEELEALAPSEPNPEADEETVAETTLSAEVAAEEEVAELAPDAAGEPVGEAPIPDDAVEPPVIDVTDEAVAPESTTETVEVAPELEAEVEEALEGVVDAEGAEVDEWVPGDWFVVHTYAGYENKVKVDLETRVTSMNMEDKIYEIVIPMEDVVEIKNGKKQTVQRKVFPGYLLVRMEMDDDSWYVVRNTPGVTGFVGSGTKPIPLSEKEVGNILGRGKAGEEAEKAVKPRAEWQNGDPVRVTTGPFANFQGVINEVDPERSKVKVLVNIFGRETPVELAFDQISKV
jgi:transcription termination/antitermination protein NusG